MEKFQKAFLTVFPAFSSRNYRLYFIGQSISLIGTWMQNVAQGWLVLEITNSAFMVGLISALNLLPIFFLSLFAGVLLDHFSKRMVIILAESTAMLLAFVLGILTISHHMNIATLAVLAFLVGITNAVDLPARQSFTKDMVGKTNLHSAVALNAGIYNLARATGPAIAGIVIGIIGTGGAFIANSFSFLAAIFALFAIKVSHVVLPQRPETITAIENVIQNTTMCSQIDSDIFEEKKQILNVAVNIKEGLLYAFANRLIRTYLFITASTAIFGWSYVAIMPVVAKQVFHTNAAGLGVLHSAAGIGALVGTIIVSSLAKSYSPIRFIVIGNLTFTLALITFSFIRNFTLSLPFLFLAGLGLILSTTMINTSIQHMVPDNIRGRMMSIYTLMFVGMSAIGSFQIGLLSEHLGAMAAIRIGACIVLLCGVYLLFNRRKLQTAYEAHIYNEGRSAAIL